jgi:CPA2 family monovalent cation:H+ antiporter-2
VFLLFAIGLELTFERLIQMRWFVFGFGGLQLVFTSILMGLVLHNFFHLSLTVAIFVGCALALSSTAIVLQVMTEHRLHPTQVGRLSLSVLLMQDFAVVPLLAILPFISSSESSAQLLNTIGISALKALAAIFVITIIGRLFLKPFLNIIGSAKSEEVYVSTTLLIVLGAAALTTTMDLSSAMGAFMAGILIAETEYRNRVEHSILPFKNLLLGLFFLSVGMSIDFKFIQQNIASVLLAASVLLLIKAVIIFLLCRLFKIRLGASIHSTLLLCQGSEFAFILFTLASSQGVLEPVLSQFLLVVVAISMAVTPMLASLGAIVQNKLDWQEDLDKNQEFKGVSDLDNHVIIAGFGRVGRVIAYMLSHLQINYVAVDSNLMLVKKGRSKGFPVYHGDLSDAEVMMSVGAERARCVVFTTTEKSDLRKAIKMVAANYKNLEIITRAEDFKHCRNLKKLGASTAVPTTIETGLQLSNSLLKSLGVTEHDIVDLKERFRNNNYSFTEEIELFSGIAPSKQTDSH